MLKSCHGVELLSPNRYESDIMNKVLYTLVGQETAKISEVKFGGRKKIYRIVCTYNYIPILVDTYHGTLSFL